MSLDERRDLRAPLSVAIDGGAPAEIQPLVGGGTITIAGGLADGPHTAVLRGAELPSEVFLVGRAAPSPWLWTLAPALIVLALVVVGGQIGRVLLSWRRV